MQFDTNERGGTRELSEIPEPEMSDDECADMINRCLDGIRPALLSREKCVLFKLLLEIWKRGCPDRQCSDWAWVAIDRDEIAAFCNLGSGAISDICARLKARGVLRVERTGRQARYVVNFQTIFSGRVRDIRRSKKWTPIEESAPPRPTEAVQQPSATEWFGVWTVRCPVPDSALDS